jgi:rifampicin phosphotransferase
MQHPRWSGNQWFLPHHQREKPSTVSYILTPPQSDQRQLGGKARALAALADADVAIPAWFALSPAAFDHSLTPAQRTILSTAVDSDEALSALATFTLAPEIEQALHDALARLCPDGALIAVRSSARDEDGAHHSFAGQLTSFLNVPLAEVPAKVIEVWRSGFGERVYAYRRLHQLPLPPPAPAVLIQRMVQADAAGVAFSADPVSGRRTALISAVRGLGEALVAGAVDADTYTVEPDGTIRQRQLIAPTQPVLADPQVRAVAKLARRAERQFGRPQDIEWALAGAQLYLLQSRPITGVARLADPDGVYTLWDNSNIVESYGGVTTPLTYSFARRAYETVYQEFCRIMACVRPPSPPTSLSLPA